MIELKRQIDMYDVVNKHLIEVMDDPRYKYYFLGTYINLFEKENNVGWNNDLMLIYLKNKVIGHISWSIDQTLHSVTSVELMIYPQWYGKGLGVKAMYYWVMYIFTTRKYHMLWFESSSSNPFINSYKRGLRELGGRHIGTKKNAAVLINGTITDLELFELSFEKYIAFFKKSTNE